jgi:hypothetical protein
LAIHIKCLAGSLLECLAGPAPVPALLFPPGNIIKNFAEPGIIAIYLKEKNK